MKTPTLSILTLALAVLSPCSAFAHTSYSNRNFGSLNPSNPSAPSTLTGGASAISGLHGWADGTDADYGDAHRIKAFRFTLETAGTVIIEVESQGMDNPLLPAFSLYAGLLHFTPHASATDAAPLTLDYLAALGGEEKEGAFFALGDMAMGNEGNDTHAPSMRYLTYVGHAADGTATNYGPAAGINGDGVADGFVRGSFYLAAGDYSILVGGADYYTVGVAPFTSYAARITLTAVPEPSTWALLGAALLGLVMIRHRGLLALRPRR